MTGTLAVVLVLGGLIFFHELGHFLMARVQGIGVKTFSLGFGPQLWGISHKRTQYKISAIPLGGYVSLVGESQDPDKDTDWPQETHFITRPPLQKLLVVLAGPVFNFILAWLLYWVIFLQLGYVPIYEYTIHKVVPNSPAMYADLRAGDIITKIDGDLSYTPETIQMTILFAQDDPLVFQIRRGNSIIEKKITPAFLSEEDKYGELIPKPKVGIAFQPALIEQDLGLSFGADAALDKCTDAIVQTIQSMALIVSGTVSPKAIGGPIMIVQEVGSRAKNGLISVIFLAAFISINLGVLNLLPIPVLDGGHIIFFAFEALTRKPVNEKIQRMAGYFGMAILMSLMLLAFYNDIYRLFTTA